VSSLVRNLVFQWPGLVHTWMGVISSLFFFSLVPVSTFMIPSFFPGFLRRKLIPYARPLWASPRIQSLLEPCTCSRTMQHRKPLHMHYFIQLMSGSREVALFYSDGLRGLKARRWNGIWVCIFHHIASALVFQMIEEGGILYVQILCQASRPRIRSDPLTFWVYFTNLGSEVTSTT